MGISKKQKIIVNIFRAFSVFLFYIVGMTISFHMYGSFISKAIPLKDQLNEEKKYFLFLSILYIITILSVIINCFLIEKWKYTSNNNLGKVKSFSKDILAKYGQFLVFLVFYLLEY